ncbi:uncharacterized protein LOC121315194 isoform X2 [Polyodon spathula]|nr:uncharacterized protein LOC121315194 isoform X2 [Polyodon spathula]
MSQEDTEQGMSTFSSEVHHIYEASDKGNQKCKEQSQSYNLKELSGKMYLVTTETERHTAADVFTAETADTCWENEPKPIDCETPHGRYVSDCCTADTQGAGLTRCDFTQDFQGSQVTAHRAMHMLPDRKSSRGREESSCLSERLNPETFGKRLLNLDKSTLTQTVSNCSQTLRKYKLSDSQQMQSPRSLEGSVGVDKENKCMATLTRAMSPSDSSPLTPIQMNWEMDQSPTKRAKTEENTCSTLAMGQDSQGNKVISHRNMMGRAGNSPLKGKTNQTQSRRTSMNRYSNTALSGRDTIQDDKDCDSRPYPLFTQDFEGNMVMKHF